MTNDLERTLGELPAGCRDVVARLRASAEVSPRAVAVGRWRPVPLATAAALAAALLGVAAFFASDRASETRRLKGPREYVLAAQPSADAALEIVRLQKADGSWQNDFLTRRNAAALKTCPDARAQLAYRKAMRNLRVRGLL